MPDFEEPDYQPVPDGRRNPEAIPGTNIETTGHLQLTSPPEHVLFDFDGTLSLVRAGWPDVMVTMMVQFLSDTGTDESPAQLREVAWDFIMELNGKQTIYQMIRLADEIKQRSGTPKSPDEYKQIYHDRLMEKIQGRRRALANGTEPPASHLVQGSRQLLQSLADRGVTLYLASGTDHQYVQEEAELLGIARFFGNRIYGAQHDYKTFSKARVIADLLEANNVAGDRLLSFGDGFVEIQNTKSVGGIAVAVASDETERSGKIDTWKRDRLVGVGADFVVPDYSDAGPLLDYIWNCSN